jgi:hypothetical protein
MGSGLRLIAARAPGSMIPPRGQSFLLESRICTPSWRLTRCNDFIIYGKLPSCKTYRAFPHHRRAGHSAAHGQVRPTGGPPHVAQLKEDMPCVHSI